MVRTLTEVKMLKLPDSPASTYIGDTGLPTGSGGYGFYYGLAYDECSRTLYMTVVESPAGLTDLYTVDELPGTLVVAVVNFPKKQIGPFMSECLVTGFHDDEGRVVLCRPESDVPLGSKLA